MAPSLTYTILGPDEGAVLEAMYAESDLSFPAGTWDNLPPHWLAAKDGKRVVGVCQILVSRPIGFVENLTVSPAADKRTRLTAVRGLMDQSMALLKSMGVEYVGGVVKSTNPRFARVLEKNGFSTGSLSTLYTKKL
jgi:ribosomal protein S18 acetylase RimI-like enzyme